MSTFRRTVGFVLVCCLLLGVLGVAVAEHTHKWVEVELYPATCDSLGRIQKTCSECDKVEYVDIPAEGHSWGPYVNIHPATCTSKAVEQSICSRCETKDVRETGAPLPHQMTGWKVIKEATCTDDGYKENKCLTCTTQYDSVPIGRLGHDWGPGWVVDVDPVCGVAGLEKRECSRCKTVETRALKALEHKFSEWKITQTRACDKDEIQTRECSLCKRVETKTTKTDIGSVSAVHFFILLYLEMRLSHAPLFSRHKNTITRTHRFRSPWRSQKGPRRLSESRVRNRWPMP